MRKQLTRESVLRTLKEYKTTSPYKRRIKAIGLFGSLAKDSRRMGSDVDVFVDLKPGRMFDLIGIKQDLESAFKCKVDIVVLWKKLNPVLRSQIEKYGIHVR